MTVVKIKKETILFEIPLLKQAGGKLLAEWSENDNRLKFHLLPSSTSVMAFTYEFKSY